MSRYPVHLPPVGVGPSRNALWLRTPTGLGILIANGPWGLWRSCRQLAVVGNVAGQSILSTRQHDRPGGGKGVASTDATT